MSEKITWSRLFNDMNKGNIAARAVNWTGFFTCALITLFALVSIPFRMGLALATTLLNI